MPTIWRNAFEVDFNDGRGWVIVRRDSFGHEGEPAELAAPYEGREFPREILEVGARILLVSIEESDAYGYDGFGCEVRITGFRDDIHARQTHFLIETDLRERARESRGWRG